MSKLQLTCSRILGSLSPKLLMARFMRSSAYTYYCLWVGVTSHNKASREKASLALQSVFMSAEPRIPIRLLIRLNEALEDRNLDRLRYVLEEFAHADFSDRKMFQIDYDYEREYLQNLNRRASEAWKGKAA